jgi:hypothetical protein
MQRIMIFIVASASLSACVSNRTSVRTIHQAEARWMAADISDYSFKFLKNAQVPDTECGEADQPIDVEVRGGRTTKFGTCDVNSGFAQAFGSIPSIFSTLRAERGRHPPGLEVEFNDALGYPEVISINHARWVTDSGVNYFVRDLRKIE